MAKDKKGTKTAAAAPAKVDTVKAGRVSKSADKPKAVAKETAKKAAKEVEKTSKKSKKAKKEPTPEPSSSEESESSESEVEEKPKANGAAKAVAAETSDDSSDDSSESEAEGPAPKSNGVALNGSAKKAETSDSSDSDSSDSDAEAPATAGAKDAEMKDADSSDDSSDSSEDEAPAAKTNSAAKAEATSDDSSDDSSDSDEEEAPKVEEKPSKKRKAETEVEPTPKKTKVMVEGEEKEATANLFIGNLSWNVDEDWLTREFEEFGELAGVRIITDRDSGRSKGFGYVEFTDVDNAVKAQEAKHGSQLDNRDLRVDFSQPRQNNAAGTPQQRQNDRAKQFGDTTNPPANTLFLGNLSFDCDEATLTEVFQEYGSISSIRLPTDRETGAPKGFGYLEMGSIEEATAAFDALQGSQIVGRPIRLDYAQARADNGGGDRGGRGRGRGGFGDRGGRGGFGDRGGRGGRGGGRGGFDRGGRGGGRGRGGDRGGRGGTTNRGGFGDFSGKKVTF